MLARPTLAIAAIAAGTIFAPAAHAAAPPALQVEQVDRASGPAGAYGLSITSLPVRAAMITSDGRYSFFGVRTPPFGAENFAADAIPGDGLYMRDIVANRTTRIGDGSGVFTGLDRSEHLVSFVTPQALDPSDTNGLPDLYVFEPTTGIKVLVSRATGARGAALGLTSFGTITRGSTTAVFGTADGIYRRNLLTARTTKVAPGTLLKPLTADQYYPALPQPADQYVSADGQVFTSADGIVTPSHTYPLPVDSIGQTVLPFINEAGTLAIWQGDHSALDTVRVMNLATGVITAPPVPSSFEFGSGELERPTPDGRGGYFGTTSTAPDLTITGVTRKWTFATGGTVDLGHITMLSRSEHFGLIGFGPQALLAAAGTGYRLPGTVDLPSPNAYVFYDDGCAWDGAGNVSRSMYVTTKWNSDLPVATTVRFRASHGAGSPVVVDQTVPVPTNDFGNGPAVDLPFGDGAFRLDVTVTMADGRTVTERTVHTPRPVDPSC